eukprot:1267220-Rhodomonas_salina.1
MRIRLHTGVKYPIQNSTPFELSTRNFVPSVVVVLLLAVVVLLKLGQGGGKEDPVRTPQPHRQQPAMPNATSAAHASR